MDTLESAKRWLRQHFDARKAVRCPCCGQRVARDRRSLNSGMARALLWMCKTSKFTESWINVPLTAPPYVIANREYPRLEDWGLIRQMPNEDPTKKTSGIWSVTASGLAFARREKTVSKFYFMFDRKIAGWSKDEISIDDALGKKFDYRDVIGD